MKCQATSLSQALATVLVSAPDVAVSGTVAVVLMSAASGNVLVSLSSLALPAALLRSRDRLQSTTVTDVYGSSSSRPVSP